MKIKEGVYLVSCCIITIVAVCGPKTVSAQDFRPEFTIVYREDDPGLAMRPGGIEKVPYNVATWKTYGKRTADLAQARQDEAAAGDGFDKRILEGEASGRTVRICHAGETVKITGEKIRENGDTLFYAFPEHPLFSLEACLVTGHRPYPLLHYELIPRQHGWFSVGYTGAPVQELSEVEEIWQPLIWSEKRFPDKPYLTLAYRCPIPTALVDDKTRTTGVLAAPEEFPFDPLPLPENSRFGIGVRNEEGKVQPRLWAPVLGGSGSKMQPEARFSFNILLPSVPGSLTDAYEEIARKVFGFQGYRRNEIASLNEVFYNITRYSMSDYARFIDSLKGCAYSTDVPGAVKNVSSLHPLELALVTDNRELFEKRAYPVMEYMLSREKFLFSLDKEQKIQHPSRKMAGPVAPVSELVSLYNIFGKRNRFLLELAKKEYENTRTRNLDAKETGKTWINAMHLYRASGEERYLRQAREGADRYLKERVEQRQTGFEDPFAGGFFFWKAFTNRWIELLELYEITGEDRYLQAARDGARHYTLFCWMSPAIPDSLVTVNKGGKAPLYWYLKSKGHKQMHYPEEQVPAWRLSEIGLTPESSGTSTGHRAIFMANYAPWMLRLGYYTGDEFLKEVAGNAIIGRYRNFPGYHINTARTTAYEKEDYPLHTHKELSVNSFHYNHIMPMASMLLDYLVTDAFVRSGGEIDFPSEYIEGYAYLQNKLYGNRKGRFYGEEGVQLWMPEGLLQTGQVELNYITARKDDCLFIVFTNQSEEAVQARVKVNPEMLSFSPDTRVAVWKENKRVREMIPAGPGLEISVAAKGITALELKGVHTQPVFQDQLLEQYAGPRTDYVDYKELEPGHTKAMLFSLGGYGQRAYIYLGDDDSKVSSARLVYEDEQGRETEAIDRSYPFEFTVPLTGGQEVLRFRLRVFDRSGHIQESREVRLGNQ